MGSDSSYRRRLRWTPPVAILLAAIAAIGFMHFSERVESYIAAYLISAVIVLAIGSLFVWFVRFSGFEPRIRRRGAVGFIALILVAAIAIKLTTRVQGVINGVGVPKLVWRWSPRVGSELPPVAVESHATVDLTQTTPLDFPEFLGPGRRNALEGIGLGREWSHVPHLLWRQPIGAGWSSFAAVGRWAVTQEQRGDCELVVCYEIANGKPQWVHADDHTRFVDSQGGDGPRATPTICGGRVFTMGATGILNCLDGSDGKVIWSRNGVGEPSQNLTYGKSCSPLIVDDKVVVTGGRGGPSLIAYAAADGTPVWSSGSESPGYASPIFATLANVRQIITINAHSVTAHDPADGHVLWRFDSPGSMPKNIQPIPLKGDQLLISAGYGLGTTLLKVNAAGGALSVAPVWTSHHLKPKLTNNVVRGNYVYGLDDPGVLTCLDLSTGKRMWRNGSYGFGQLLRVDDLLLVQCESGEVALVDPSPDGLHEIARFRALENRTWSCPALVGHRLLVRNDQEAACFELP
ncbi:MAG TPA: PQQ-binding-like beta-propeller repeat protein [Tepidisphaeraceae bacterium]|jgi:outer membrane protein assembly factor BamB